MLALGAGCGRDGPTRKDGRTAYSVFFTSRPPAALENVAGWLSNLSKENEAMRSNVIPLPGQATATPTTTPQELAAMQAHQAAENALAMALHYLRANASNIPGATRKAVQALAALNTLQVLAPAGAGARVQIGGGH